MNCPYCGFDNEPDSNYCQKCGSRLSASHQHHTQTSYNETNWNAAYSSHEPNFIINGKDYTPISMWGYFGYQLLFSIPIVGLICLCIFAFGGTNKINLRNFARSYFCVLILILVFIFLFSGCVATGLGISMHDYLSLPLHV